MLDQLRRHASSFIVKGVLTLIILTFILFFGYTRLTSRYHDEHLYVASVNGKGIPRRKFDVSYQASLEQLKTGLKDQMPENFEGFLKQNVMNQLIGRELLFQYGARLGFTISDEEIAQEIRSDKNLFPEGSFDLTSYEEKFLPYYRQRYGDDFEEVVARDLLIQKVQSVANPLFSPWQEEIASKIPPEELFSLWVDKFRKETRVEIFNR